MDYRLEYIEDIASDIPPYTGRLCGACGFDPYPAQNIEVTNQYSICGPCEKKARDKRDRDNDRREAAWGRDN